MMKCIQRLIIKNNLSSYNIDFHGYCRKKYSKNLFIQGLWSRFFNQKTFANTTNRLDRVCIIGSGPAGFYTAKYLLKTHAYVKVDMIEALPTPYGLVRYGVAPDHPEVKSVMKDFANVASSDRFSFLGNVTIGKDINIDDLKPYYNAIVCAYGTSDDRKLNIPGEELNNVLSARSFVNWYNGHPFFQDFNVNLNCKTVMIIGQGNVALDCARILCKSKEELIKTDITTQALEAIEKSTIEKIIIVGRRGSIQASFTMKEMREMNNLANTHLFISKEELHQSETKSSIQEKEKERGKKRMQDFLTKISSSCSSASSKNKQVDIRFLLSPVKMLPNSMDSSKIGSVLFEKTRLEGEMYQQKAIGCKEYEKIDCDLVLRSIGYRSSPLPSLPFDTSTFTIPHVYGRVINNQRQQHELGLYVAGWLKRGPSGIIGTNIIDAKETVSSIKQDEQNNQLKRIEKEGGINEIENILIRNGKHDFLHWDQVLKLHQYENKDKIPHKITSIKRMLDIAMD